MKPLESNEIKLVKRIFRSIVAGIVASVMFFNVHPGGSAAFALSLEEERIAGEKFAQSIRQQFDVMDDAFVDGYINDLGHYLVRFLDTQPFPFRFYVINDEILNAFAGPGGHIFIFSGLVIVMDNADELGQDLSFVLIIAYYYHFSESESIQPHSTRLSSVYPRIFRP